MRLFLAVILFAVPASAAEFSNAVVNLSNGSGVIIVKGEEKAYGISAAHCCPSTQDTFQITTVSGKESTARWLLVDRKKDLALFVAWSKDVDGVAHVLSPLPTSPEWTAIGYPAKYQGREAVKTLKFRGRNKEMLSTDGKTFDRNQFTLTSGYFGGGDSGGGVFAHHQRSGVSGLVGIMTHGGVSATTNEQLVTFVESGYAQMSKDCQQCIEKWQVPPPPPEERDLRPGQHNLPEYLDSDRERGLIIAQLLEDRKQMLERIDQLERQINELKTDVRTGPPGPPGLDGKDGDNGKDGEDAVVDYDKLASEVKKRLPPIPSSFTIRPLKRK